MNETELNEKIVELTTGIKGLVAVMGETSQTDKARWDAADAERVRMAGELETVQAENCLLYTSPSPRD